jgi:hypothetical protein
MSVAAYASLGACTFSIVLIAACAIALVVGVKKLAKRAQTLASHPTVAALGRLPRIAERFKAVGPGVERARSNVAAAAESLAFFASSAARIGLNVDRGAFATKLFLSTFLPTLAGSMADE